MVEIIPFISVGFIRLGDKITNYEPESNGGYEPITEYTTYNFCNNNIAAFVEGIRIVAIAIYFDCYLDGVNLYGLEINDFFEKFKIPHIFRSVDDRCWVSDDEQQNVYQIETLGLQIWVNDLGRIVTIICDLE